MAVTTVTTLSNQDFSTLPRHFLTVTIAIKKKLGRDCIRKNFVPMMPIKCTRALFVFLLLVSQVCANAQTSDFGNSLERDNSDTLRTIANLSVDETERAQFNAKQLILPGALIAVGVFGVSNGGFKNLNADIQNSMSHLRGNCYFHADDYLQYLPALTYLTFGSIGIKSKHCFKERLVVGTTAYLSMTALTNIGKYSFREKRPDTSARNSFPSGHTATVFTGAELMREEYGWGIGIGAYAVAGGIAFLRLYNERHWLNDVIAGMGVGILSARIGYWMLPLYKRWFKWNDAASEAMVVLPTYNPIGHSFSFNLAYTF